MSRLRFVAVASICIAAAFAAPSPRSFAASKLDRALNVWLQRPAGTARVLIRTRPGETSRVQNRVAALAPESLRSSTTPDLIVPQPNPAALRAVTREPDVLRVSSDALVKTLGTENLSQDVLLNTEGLLPRGDAKGDHVTVAVIDSGILSNPNAKAESTFDFLQGGKKV